MLCTTAEFARRVEAGEGLLLDILAKPRLFVIGSDHVLANLAGRLAEEPAADQ